MTDAGAKMQQESNLAKAATALVTAYPYGSLKVNEAEDLALVYAMGAQSHIQGGYGKDIFVPMPFTPKKYPRAPHSFHSALFHMLKGTKEFDIAGPWGKTKEKIEPFESKYSENHGWAEEKYIKKRADAIIQEKRESHITMRS